jgi:hypothetical protein
MRKPWQSEAASRGLLLIFVNSQQPVCKLLAHNSCSADLEAEMTSTADIKQNSRMLQLNIGQRGGTTS